ncbi:hypothetical protein [Rhodoplanes roseus]|uniref:hypothetical protein n=1 Tax=Rhodoplanes roseus TaxID=29409 RepID=UPI0011B35C6E|nr:hypothetical protein [Rhodoplanes roseus]
MDENAGALLDVAMQQLSKVRQQGFRSTDIAAAPLELHDPREATVHQLTPGGYARLRRDESIVKVLPLHPMLKIGKRQGSF